MATKSKLLQAAAGTAAASGGGGAVGLNVEDVFSTQIYGGNGNSKPIENNIALGQSYGSGGAYFDDDPNLGGGYISNPAGLDFASASEFALGDFTAEGFVFFKEGSGIMPFCSIGQYQTGLDIRLATGSGNGINTYLITGSGVGTAGALNEGQWYHIAVVRDGSTLSHYVNGTRVYSASHSSSTIPQANGSVGGITSGSLVASHRYMSNFRLSNIARYSGTSFTVPTANFTSDANTIILTLQGDTPLVDNSSYGRTLTPDTDGLGTVTATSFGPFDAAEAGDGGMVWTKDRVNGGSSIYHHIMDTEGTGLNKTLWPNDTSGLYSSYGASSWNANGYTVNSSGSAGLNNTSGDYVSWTWKKQPKFFDCVTYTGNGTSQTISHSLNSTVGMIIVKDLSTSNWSVYHRSLGATQVMFLNLSNGAFTSGIDNWNSTEPTTTAFSVGASTATNTSGNSYVAYLFAHNNGDGGFGSTGDQDVIKCGSVTTAAYGSATVSLGFEPQWLMVKSSSSSVSGWHMLDNMRGIATGGTYQNLLANSSGAEATSGSNYFEFTADGFKINAYPAAASTDWVYIAIRRGPMAVPTSGAEVFDIAPYASGDKYTTSFTPDVSMLYWTTGYDDGTNAYPEIFDRLRGKGGLQPPNNRAENTGRNGAWDHMQQFSGIFGTGAWTWKRAPQFCDVVCYTGDGVAGRTVSHNLGVAPEMMWVKTRDAAKSWRVYHSGVGATKVFYLDLTNSSITTSADWNDTAPTDSVFTLGSGTGTNASGQDFVAYLFATIDGVSKVGSYTGTGSDNHQIDCGFSNGARFVLIKAASTTGSWKVLDTRNGIVAGDDPFYHLNASVAPYTNFDLVDPYSGGFAVNSNFGEWNESGQTYIFYAVA